ncbi:hypothetical protein vBCtySFA88_00070 [Clostridium phage vB_CtyS-FA88]|nr:hypothetical protein vBCtySFA88_00070 [Clostridium phage vB_CtyS-FA88]
MEKDENLKEAILIRFEGEDDNRMGSVQFAINGHEDLEVGISLLVRAALETGMPIEMLASCVAAGVQDFTNDAMSNGTTKKEEK